MDNKTGNQTRLVEVGQRLLHHSKDVEFTARRGLVVELYPFIFGAGQRMSARAISRFLESEQGVKLSSVTINKALKDPAKQWNLFFDMIEPAARVYGREDKKALRDFLFDEPKKWKPLKNRAFRAVVNFVNPDELTRAVAVLREKWFVIDLEIRQKARPYVEQRLT
jgi:hypothetical protein